MAAFAIFFEHAEDHPSQLSRQRPFMSDERRRRLAKDGVEKLDGVRAGERAASF
jgi:hypothetical protein